MLGKIKYDVKKDYDDDNTRPGGGGGGGTPGLPGPPKTP